MAQNSETTYSKRMKENKPPPIKCPKYSKCMKENKPPIECFKYEEEEKEEDIINDEKTRISLLRKKKVEKIYFDYGPDFYSEVDEILEKYKGHESELFAYLENKFNISVAYKSDIQKNKTHKNFKNDILTELENIHTQLIKMRNMLLYEYNQDLYNELWIILIIIGITTTVFANLTFCYYMNTLPIYLYFIVFLLGTKPFFEKIFNKILINKGKVQIHDEEVIVTSEKNINIHKCTNSSIFHNWKLNLDKNFKVISIHFQSIDMFGKDKIGFIKMKVDIIDRISNDVIPGICFLRGGSVAVLVLIKSRQTDKIYTVLTSQPRVPIGEYSCEEIPAGMLDPLGDFVGNAARELKEETGLKFNTNQLINMTNIAYPEKKGIYPSAGGCDEFICIFLANSTMDDEDIQKLQGIQTGVKEEGEKIKVKVIPYEELWKINDSKALSAITLYENIKKQYDSSFPFTEV